MKITTQGVIEKTIMSRGKLAVFGLLTFVAAGVQSCTAVSIRDGRITARDVTCTVASVNEHGEIRLNCPAEGRKDLTDESLALAYVTNPRPLTCTLRTGFTPECEIAD